MDQLKNLNKAFIGLLKKNYSVGLDGKEESYKIIRTKTAGYLYVDTIYDIDYKTYTEINSSSSYQNYLSFCYKDLFEAEQSNSSANNYPSYTSTSNKDCWKDFIVPHITYGLFVERGCRFIPIMYPENDEEFLETLNNRDNRDIWGKNYCYALEANKVYLIPNIKISSGYKAIDVIFTIKTQDFDKRMADKKRNKKKRLNQRFLAGDDEITEGTDLLWTYE